MTEVEDLLDPGAHYDLVMAATKALLAEDGPEDVELLVRRFGFEVAYDYREGPSWSQILMDGPSASLRALAGYLGADLATAVISESVSTEVAPFDAYAELVSAETALREVIRAAVPEWGSQLTEADLERLATKRTEEEKRRDGIEVSQDLLDYTEIFQLEKLINANWAAVKTILDDQARTKVYMGIIIDVRNTIGHSRPVVPAERLLLAGAAGQIRNQLSQYRSTVDGAKSHYASIDSTRDSVGTEGVGDGRLYGLGAGLFAPRRLKVGDEIVFELEGTDPKSRELYWRIFIGRGVASPYEISHQAQLSAEGDRTSILWTVGRDHVGENRYITVTLHNSSEFQRFDNNYDDARVFLYHVDPPN